MDRLAKAKDDLIKHIERNNRRFRRNILGVIGITAVGGLLFHDQIMDHITRRSTHVVNGTIMDPEFRKQTKDLSNVTVAELCQDPEFQQQVADLVVRTLNRKDVQVGAEDLVTNMLNRPDFQQKAADSIYQIILKSVTPKFFSSNS